MEEKGFNEIELEEDYLVIAAPVDTLEVTIKAKVWHNGSVIEVGKTMDLKEVRRAFEEARNGYIPEDAVFTLTDKGKEYLERLKQEQRERMECDDEG